MGGDEVAGVKKCNEPAHGLGVQLKLPFLASLSSSVALGGQLGGSP